MPVYPSGGTIAQSVGSPGFGPAPTPSYNASASVRLNPADTANISFNPTIEGSRTTWTLAFWAKRSLLATRQFLVSNYNSGTTIGFVMEFDASDRLDIYDFTNPTYSPRLITTQVFRDVGAWYHFTVVLDTSQATNTDRFKLFVNGVQVTAFSTATYPAQFYQGNWNRVGFLSSFGKAGSYPGALYYYSGYFADMNFVDGLALTPSSFTSTDANTGQLVPIQYTGSFGINGCYLPFSGAALAVDLGQNPKTTAQDYPYWPYNTLLVNTTSTNGAQNNTFLDSSTNNFTITRNGNTTQGNFTPFNYGGGTAQANGYYSGYFDSTGDYLSLPASGNASYINGTGNFTIDFWVYYNALPTGSIGANTGCSWYAQDSGLAIVSPFNLIQAGNTWYLYADTGAGTWNIFSQVTIATTTLSAGQWYHVACVRDSTNIRLYINGVQVGTASIGAASIWQNTVRNLYLFGAWQNTAGSTGLNGYVSNYRLVKGTCLYPNGTTFTVPTTPLTAIANTSLLTCQSSQFIDNSANAFAITSNGNSQPLPTNPFGMTAWSGYFDGTGDYLNFNGTTFNVGTGSFTLEGWVYITAYTFSSVISTWNSTTAPVGFVLGLDSSGRPFFSIGTASGAGSSDITGTSAIPLNTWVHLAATKTAGSGGTMTLYANGISVGTNTTTRSVVNTAAVIGRYYQDTNNYYINGAISNVRVVTGSVVYTSNFTPPTAPLTAISGTQLLTCQSSTFVDNSTNAFPITVNGNSYTGTLNNPFGNPINYTTPPVQAWSNYFDGTGDYLSTTVSAAQVGTGDFTIEFFCYLPQALDANDTLLSHGYAAAAFTNGWYLQSNGTRLSFGIGNAAGGSAVASNTDTPVRRWFHFAITRAGSLLRVWQDGLLTGSMTNAQNGTATNFFTIASASTNYYCTCNISNLRIIKGRSIYNANFTVPTSPLTAVQNTSLLTCQSNTFVDNSITNATVTKNGDALISSNSPFFPTQAWSAASYGGTMYFDGTGDYLTVPSNAAFDLGSGNATIETWIYPTTSGQTCGIFDKRSVGTNYSQFPQVALVSGAFVAYVSYSGSSWAGTINGATPAVNTWTHVAFVRNGNTWTLYVNGVISGTPFTAAGSVYASTDSLVIGASTTGGLNPFSGYISNARILKGTALYTTPFVPPALPFTNISNTSLLLNATNSGIYDATGNNAIETVGNAQVSTAVKKWGTSSVYFDGSGDYLTISNASNSVVFGTSDFTIELWVYFSSFAGNPMVYDARPSGTNGAYVTIYAVTTGVLNLFVNSLDRITSSALSINTWYHVAISRVSSSTRMFINGTQAGATYSDSTNYLNGTGRPFIGLNSNTTTTSYFSGYMQDVRVTRGVGRYSGNFTPPAAAFAYNQYDIGNQQWTPNNISVTAGVGKDNLVDSPSDYGTDTGLGGQVRGNYATLNPLQNGGVTLTNGNLDGTSAPANWITTYATIGISSGKWYWEGTCTRSSANEALMGIVKAGATLSSYVGFDANGWCYYTSASSSLKINNASTSAYGAIYTTGDVIGVALDLDAGTLVFYKNGVSQGTAYSSLSGQFFPAISVISNSAWVMNFGQRAFSFTAPSGFKCLVSTNLPTVNSIGTTSSTQATDYFNPLIYTGDGVSGRTVTGVGFQPDLVWIKARNQAYSNQVTDVVRGPSKALLTNDSSAELPNRTVGYVSAFASDGFTVTAGTTNIDEVNQSGTTYVAWNWKANGAGVANTAGTIPSTVSANTTSGCSIVTYTGTGANATVGHGLGATPAMIVVKNRDSSAIGGAVYHTSMGATKYLKLFQTTTGYDTEATDNTAWNGSSPTFNSNVFSVGSLNRTNSSQQMVAYCFAPVNGYSAFGSYTGNGSTDGPFVYTGFRPAFVLLKRSVGDIADWVMHDDTRSPYNVASNRLYTNKNEAEVNDSTMQIDILSNGFKLRGSGGNVNQSTNTYIYAAFAEFPFKYSRAR